MMEMKQLFKFLFVLLFICEAEFLMLETDFNTDACVPRNYRHGSVVCVCSSNYCDPLSPIRRPSFNEGTIVISSKEGARWQSDKFIFQDKGYPDADIILRMDRTKQFQKIFGFGGAFTDASALNLKSLPDKLQRQLMGAYFSPDGLEYNIGRVPIGGTDFSTKPYTYDDIPDNEEDPDLLKFHLTEEDLIYKIPMIQEALQLRDGDLKLFASPWSAPAWMKDNKSIFGKGKLLYKYYHSWAQYIVRFLKEYLKRGIKFFAITAQNEPTDGSISSFKFNSMGWNALDQGTWIAKHLGPSLDKSGLGNTSVYIVDDNRILIPRWVEKLLSVPGASKYVGGVAVHWYLDFVISPYLLDLTHDKFPHLPILYTEACVGQWPWEPAKVVLGSWVRAQDYAHDIIENLNHYVVGWTDWNLALDMKGGPNWAKNYVDSPIIVNAGQGEFYKQPMYYILGHFSKFLPRNSIRVTVNSAGNNNLVEFVGFIRPDNSSVLIILNRHSIPRQVTLLEDSNLNFQFTIQPYSIASLIWSI